VKHERKRPHGCGHRERSRSCAVGPLLVASAACIAAVFLCWACGGDEGGGRGAPGGLKEIPPGEYERLVHVEEPAPGDYGGNGEAEEPRKEYRRGGTLRGKGDADSFEVNAKYDQVDVAFVWPEGQTDFWVKVYGREGDELGDFDLDEGEIIQLLNGGKFTVEIYSKDGGGAWSATYRN
jgi:hypothetical protein